MKYSNKLMAFFLFVLFSYGVDTSAYTYSIANMSGRNVKVFLHWAGGALNKGGTWVENYDTRTLHFKGLKIGLCLNKIIGLSFDPDPKIARRIELPVPMKIVDHQFFDETKRAIRAFDKAVSEVGEIAALAGPKGVIVSKAITGLTHVVDALPDIWGYSFCRSRDFILILAYDKLLKINRIYALTPPE